MEAALKLQTNSREIQPLSRLRHRFESGWGYHQSSPKLSDQSSGSRELRAQAKHLLFFTHFYSDLPALTDRGVNSVRTKSFTWAGALGATRLSVQGHAHLVQRRTNGRPILPPACRTTHEQRGDYLAKRFTDTTKWDRENFRKLSPKAKLAFWYVTERCDHRGVWHPDFDLMSFQVGLKITRELFEIELGNYFSKLPNGAYFFPSFVTFQYGDKLNVESNVHRPILELLEKYGLTLTTPTPNQPLGNSSPRVQDKDKDKDKIFLEGGVGGDFLDLYKLYPLKKGKIPGLRACKRLIKTPEAFERVRQAIQNYRAQLERDGTEPKYIKHFGTFMNHYEEFLDPDAGACDVSAQPTKSHWDLVDAEEKAKVENG